MRDFSCECQKFCVILQLKTKILNLLSKITQSIE